ncbi:MAG: hypothetical protein WCK16_00575 [Candidatus Moraniibacteriota bacterium]
MFKKISLNKFVFLFFSIFIFLFALPRIASAGIVSCGITTTDPCTLCHLIVGIQSILDWAMNTLLIPLSITAISIAGIIYIVSSGNPTLTKQAKDIVGAVLIGFALMLGAWLIVNTIIITLFSAKTDLGIEKTDWHTFSCTTTSSSTGVLPTTTTPTTTTFKCEDFKFQTTSIKAQCNDASPELQELMLKMKNLLGDKMMINSVSDNNGGGVDCYRNNPTWKQCTNDSSTECCHHKKSSCHYGGTVGGKSEAIDVSTATGLTADNIITAAKNSGAGYWKDEAVSYNHIHVSTTKCQNN